MGPERREELGEHKSVPPSRATSQEDFCLKEPRPNSFDENGVENRSLQYNGYTQDFEELNKLNDTFKQDDCGEYLDELMDQFYKLEDRLWQIGKRYPLACYGQLHDSEH